MNPPHIDRLIRQTIRLLEGYHPETVVFLDRRGRWAEDPQTARDRISNELWHFIWQSHRADERLDILGRLYTLFCVDPIGWAVTGKVYRWLNSSADPDADEVLQVIEVLGALIQHQAWHRSGTAYLPEWDFRGKARRKESLERAQAFARGLQGCLDGTSETKRFKELWPQLSEVEGAPVDRLCGIISEEESIRDQIETVLQAFWYARREDRAMALLEEQLGPKLSMRPVHPTALLRPCLDLLTLPQLEMASGLQYEVTGILGRLRDVRSTKHLLGILEGCSRRHARVRCNAIYALGHLPNRSVLPCFVEVLTGPNSMEVALPDRASRYSQSLHAEKRECIWALGRMGMEAHEAIPVLARYGGSPDRDIAAALAWTLGCIGEEQKKKAGGLDAALMTGLLQLLQSENTAVFEESAMAMRKLGLPDFLHHLYLQNFSTVPILSLKPSSTGLYELSETIFYLMSLRTPVVMAVTGDSGTGKTYFCEAISKGFEELGGEDILYLQRDHPGHMRMFNRMLGLKWLQAHVDPQHYQDYPVTEEQDDPDLSFHQFMQQYSGRKLIILDGWRDPEYFHEVIRRFYDHGHLDVVVKFHATHSTKRLNLEEREGTLERVMAHLPLVEDPAIEETVFYREGDLLLYQLDNSLPSRLDRSEIEEVFRRKKVSAWGRNVHVGELGRESEPIPSEESLRTARRASIPLEKEEVAQKETVFFVPRETDFLRRMNEHPERQPNLLQMIDPGDGAVRRIEFFTQGQIAYGDAHGAVGILSGFQDRTFTADVHERPVRCLAVTGSSILSVDLRGELKETSFRHRRITAWAAGSSPICSLAGGRDGLVAMGHEDGTVRLWDRKAQQVFLLGDRLGPVRALAPGRSRTVLCADEAGKICLWDATGKQVIAFDGPDRSIGALSWYPDGRWVAAGRMTDRAAGKSSENSLFVEIGDPQSGRSELFDLRRPAEVRALRVYFDGRIFAGLGYPQDDHGHPTLMMLDPRSRPARVTFLSGHEVESTDCITMGPRIITCGRESDGRGTVRIFGGLSYIGSERRKTELFPRHAEKPTFCRTLF